MITNQPSLWGSEPREDKSLESHREPSKDGEGRLVCPNEKCKGRLNKKCPAVCPECGQAINRTRIK